MKMLHGNKRIMGWLGIGGGREERRGSGMGRGGQPGREEDSAQKGIMVQ